MEYNRLRDVKMKELPLINDVELIKSVEAILTSPSKDLRTTLYRDIIRNALSCKSSDLDLLDLKIVNRAVAEFIHAACVFKPYRDRRKVSIFGSARVTDGSRAPTLYGDSIRYDAPALRANSGQ